MRRRLPGGAAPRALGPILLRGIALVAAHVAYLVGFADGRAQLARDVTPRMWAALGALLSLKAVVDPSLPQEARRARGRAKAAPLH